MKPVLLRIAVGLLGISCLVASAKEARHPKTSTTPETPVPLRHLTGKIVDPKGLTVAYAQVELLDSQGHSLVTTFADAKGKFYFADRKPGEALVIRVSLKGFTTVRYAVILHRLGKVTLKVVLPVAT